MGSIPRYIFRSTFAAFLVVLISLTALIWVTQALREIDLMTNRGQSIVVFLGITSLLLPLLMMMIAPVALFVATTHVLNKLSTDSEIIVMNAAGMSPWRLFKTFIPVILIVSGVIAVTAAYVSPKSLRLLRDWVTNVNANVVSSLIQPGRFVTIASDVTIHIGSRDPNGQLRAVFVDDRRNAAERITIIADRGNTVENDQGSFLILQNGTVHHLQTGRRDPNIVTFERHALDLAQFSRNPSAPSYSAKERYMWDLLNVEQPGTRSRQRPSDFRAEFFDRLMAPIYPLAFVVIAFAYLGVPRTTRQSRGTSLAGAILAIVALRLIGFASTILGANYQPLLLVQYVAAAVAIGGGIYVIRRGIILEAPAFVTNSVSALTERLTRRFATS
jgi:lipopolysaccharide export system permease protein